MVDLDKSVSANSSGFRISLGCACLYLIALKLMLLMLARKFFQYRPAEQKEKNSNFMWSFSLLFHKVTSNRIINR